VEKERRGVDLDLTGAAGLGLGERRSSFGKAGLEPRMGFGERRSSFGKAGVTPPGGFRERRGRLRHTEKIKKQIPVRNTRNNAVLL